MWRAPTWPWCKLNTDGACKRTRASSAGGVIRDHNGVWIFGFGMNIGHCFVTMVELWGLYQGLKLAWEHGIKCLVVEIDSLCITQLVNKPVDIINEYTSLIQSIKEIIHCNWNVIINHVHREANYIAKYVANYALSFPLGVHHLSSPPLSVTPLLYHDLYRVAYPLSVLY